MQIGIANRDIKLENTLLMDESERPLLKLCDFGYSKDEYQGSACKTLCGKAPIASLAADDPCVYVYCVLQAFCCMQSARVYVCQRSLSCAHGRT